jgi:hypothetical protein
VIVHGLVVFEVDIHTRHVVLLDPVGQRLGERDRVLSGSNGFVYKGVVVRQLSLSIRSSPRSGLPVAPKAETINVIPASLYPLMTAACSAWLSRSQKAALSTAPLSLNQNARMNLLNPSTADRCGISVSQASE